MENQKNNKGVIILLIVIIVILLALCVLFATGTISFNLGSKNDSNKNSNFEQNTTQDQSQNTTSNTQNQSQNNNIDESTFVRDTRVTLIDDPNCTGQHSTPLIANIEPDGNISIAQDGGAAVIKVGNAKYLYRVSVLACNNVKLYYITEDKELYVIDGPSSTLLDQKGTKVTESKIIEFLGTEGREDGAYLKVLNENGTTEYIKYFTVPGY